MIAVKDWQFIDDGDLLLCAENARREAKYGPITNRDVLVENEKLLAQRARERRNTENQSLLSRHSAFPDKEWLKRFGEMAKYVIAGAITPAQAKQELGI